MFMVTCLISLMRVMLMQNLSFRRKIITKYIVVYSYKILVPLLEKERIN